MFSLLLIAAWIAPEAFAEAGRKLVAAGASLVGGCCGTTKEHITALARTVRLMEVPEISQKKRRLLASERQMLEIDMDGKFLVVGERINPTGKKVLQQQQKTSRQRSERFRQTESTQWFPLHIRI